MKAAPALDPPVTFNISHDSSLVVMACASREDGSGQGPLIGVDVMQVAVPARESFKPFVQFFGDQVSVVFPLSFS